MQKHADAIVLFSGGLDSILSALILRDLGLDVLCVHFYSPFFGHADKAERWRAQYGLNIEAVDASLPFIRMLAGWPPHGFGKNMNPCIDCKITLVKLARELMTARGAAFMATGEVLGQRPMSQRADALNIIDREARGLIVRPLCGRLLPSTQAEHLAPREKLLAISGRGRNEQLALARQYGLEDIPNPAGGCLLTEKENTRLFWTLLKPWLGMPEGAPLANLAEDFRAGSHGRQFFRRGSGHWLRIGRNKTDNDLVAKTARSDDLILKLPFAGPLAAARGGAVWPEEILAEAAALLAAYAPAARRTEKPLEIRILGRGASIQALPDRQEQLWNLPSWQEARDEIRELAKARQAERGRKKRIHQPPA